MKDENQLVKIVEQSGLEKTKADYILENFLDYFSIAADWERRAKELVVTNENQTDIMAMARIGRLALREKRIDLEKKRKKLKEQSLREGKAIDGIANVLKALIVPIEEHLDRQEHFVEYKKAEEERIARIEAEKKAEEERIAKEKAEAEERERVRFENEKLKKEAEERERQAVKERAEAEAKLKAEREAAAKKQREQDAVLAAERAKAEAERKAAQERERQAAEKAAQEKAKLEAELRAKAEAERKAAQERERQAAEKAAQEKAKLEAELKAKAEAERKMHEEKMAIERQLKNTIICPKCGHSFKHKGGDEIG